MLNKLDILDNKSKDISLVFIHVKYFGGFIKIRSSLKKTFEDEVSEKKSKGEEKPKQRSTFLLHTKMRLYGTFIVLLLFHLIYILHKINIFNNKNLLYVLNLIYNVGEKCKREKWLEEYYIKWRCIFFLSEYLVKLSFIGINKTDMLYYKANISKYSHLYIRRIGI